MKNRIHTNWILFSLCIFFAANSADAQTIIKGRVTDAQTREPIPYVSVSILSNNIGATTDENGYYFIQTDNPSNKLQFSFVGYKTILKTTTPGIEQIISVKMSKDEKELKEVTVKIKHQRYRNKDNPAVELIREVIDHKSENQIENFDYAEYQQYEKMKFFISNTPEKLRSHPIWKRFPFLTRNLDTFTLEGKALMPWYIKEELADVYYRKNPEKKKMYVTGQKKIDFGEFLDNDGLNDYFRHMYQDIDIYKNNIRVVTNEFLSPVSSLAPTFYKFYIIDTTEHEGVKWVALSFFPRNNTDMLFQGRMYITLDGHFSITKVDMRVNKHINLNWVQDLHIILDFDKNSNEHGYHLSKSSLMADFGIAKKAKAGIYGERIVSFNNYLLNVSRPDSIYKGLDVEKAESFKEQPDSFLVEHRPDSLTIFEKQSYKSLDSLKNSKQFKRVMDIATLVLFGYKTITPYFEAGPVSTFYSFNPVEGFRLRFGGRTTPQLSKRYYTEAYGAYGFTDKRWKFFLSGTYSFVNRSIYQFPQHYLRANFQRETKIPGQELQFVQEDNFFLSFKRGNNDKWLYNDIYNVIYRREFRNHFSYEFNYKNWKQTPAGSLQYVDNGATPKPVPNITTSEFGLELRYAPHEEFYTGKLYRYPIFNQYPIITLRMIDGIKGFVNGQYNYQNITLNLYKHCYFSQLGYADVAVEGNYIFGKVPFPLLNIHRANQSYGLQLESYNLMNFLEFVSDQSISFFYDHCFNGFFINKIPLLKKTKLREYADFKILYGGIRDENNPSKNSDLLKFPTDGNGTTTTFTLERKPYIEASVGIGNIINFVRLDLIKRFTYLENPTVSSIGIRARVKFDF